VYEFSTFSHIEFGKELQSSLLAEGAVVFTFVRECILIQQVMRDYPNVIPVLLDVNAKDGLDEGYKLLMSFPALDHIVNLSGDPGLDIISKAYSNWK
jgi:short-subunit dehydrogenase involved in D-alanine esterification of teichoic acids